MLVGLRFWKGEVFLVDIETGEIFSETRQSTEDWLRENEGSYVLLAL